MQTFTVERVIPCPIIPPRPPVVLGTSLVVDLEEFPELEWLSTYLDCLRTLQSEYDHLTQAIATLTNEGTVYRDYWIETYTKHKNNKHYTYYQLRWLTGERKKSGQPQVKTKHLARPVVAAVRAAIHRGQQIAVLEQQQQVIAADITRLQQLVRGTSRRLQRALSQNADGADLAGGTP